MGKVIKHGFWVAFKWMVFQQCLRGYGAQNTVMYRQCLCKSQLLSLGHCALFTKLLELPSTGVARARIISSNFSFPFVSELSSIFWLLLRLLQTTFYKTCSTFEQFSCTYYHIAERCWCQTCAQITVCRYHAGTGAAGETERIKESALITKIL